MTSLVVGAVVAFGFAGVALADAIPPTEEQVRAAARDLIPAEYETRDEEAGAPKTWLGVQAAYAAQIIADPGDATLEEQERALDSRARELVGRSSPTAWSR